VVLIVYFYKEKTIGKEKSKYFMKKIAKENVKNVDILESKK